MTMSLALFGSNDHIMKVLERRALQERDTISQSHISRSAYLISYAAAGFIIVHALSAIIS